MLRTRRHGLIKGLGIITATIGVTFLTGCSEDTQSEPQNRTTYKPALEDDMQKTTIDDVKQKAGELVDTAKQFASQTKAEFQKSMDDQLAKLDQQIEEYEKRGEKLNEQAREEFDRKLAELKEKRKEYAKSLAEFKAESGEAWKEMKSGLNEAWSELKSAADQAGEQFN